MILFGFVVASMAIGSAILALDEPKYSTQAAYEISPQPPFKGKGERISDVSRTFFDAKTFIKWKDGHPSTLLTVDLIDERTLDQGAYFGTKEEQRLISISTTNITINSNENRLIFEVLEYFEFVGLLISENTMMRLKEREVDLTNLENSYFLR